MHLRLEMYRPPRIISESIRESPIRYHIIKVSRRGLGILKERARESLRCNGKVKLPASSHACTHPGAEEVQVIACSPGCAEEEPTPEAEGAAVAGAVCCVRVRLFVLLGKARQPLSLSISLYLYLYQPRSCACQTQIRCRKWPSLANFTQAVAVQDDPGEC